MVVEYVTGWLAQLSQTESLTHNPHERTYVRNPLAQRRTVNL